jgi:hypothetical protein
MSAKWGEKKWDKIVENIDSGEDSDAGDSLNIMSVQRHAHSVASILHGAVPGLDRSQAHTLPKGVNNLDFIRQGLAAGMIAEFRRSRASQGPHGPTEGPSDASGPSDAGTDPTPAGPSDAAAPNAAAPEEERTAEDAEEGVLV